MYSVLLIVANLCLLLLNTNASPIRTTTVYDALQITPAPLAAQSHLVNFLSLSSELCQDNVRSVGCEPPASLPEKTEPAQQSSSVLNVHSVGCELPVRHGKHCNMIAGECVCHQLDPEWPNIWRYPSYTIERRAEDKPTPTPTPTRRETISIRLPHDLAGTSIWLAPLSLLTKIEGDFLNQLEGKPTPTATSTETSSVGHPRDPAWPNNLFLPTQNVPEVENKPASTPTPTELSSEEERRILEAALEAAEAYHTLSPRDDDEELRKCPQGRYCNKLHMTLPPPAQPGVVSKTDISHPTLSHRDEEAQPTAPQPSTMTTVHIRTPTTTTAPCDPLASECPNPYYQRCDPTEHECFWDHALPRPPQHEKGIHTSPEKLCGVNDQMCRKNWHLQPTKTGEEKRDVDIVIPSDMSAMTINPLCTTPPFLC